MNLPDLNLLVTLDVLLAEGSVAGAARRLRLSPSAMSRALARLRAATGDPLLVRAGRGLVPTPRALELRGQVGAIVEQARAALRPATALDLGRLDRVFTLRTSEGFVETFGAALIARAAAAAPWVRLRFTAKPERDSTPLRDGTVDLETGVAGPDTGPELRVQALFRDRFVGVVRPGHPILAQAVTPRTYAAASHVAVTRARPDKGPVDRALSALGLERRVVALVAGYAGALAVARDSDLVATVSARHTVGLRAGMAAFDLPFDIPPVTVSLLWHPRLDADPAHRWLRGIVREICGDAGGDDDPLAESARSVHSYQGQ
ncbi:MAG: LysR family transcriptional regulator [Niveispirillum sp.]|nr:LysR family transcriptional regulator [Niveispirillum sp.]MBP7339688.1 LysR family transcriptional regulator [Niveispirillum sp.]